MKNTSRLNRLEIAILLCVMPLMACDSSPTHREVEALIPFIESIDEEYVEEVTDPVIRRLDKEDYLLKMLITDGHVRAMPADGRVLYANWDGTDLRPLGNSDKWLDQDYMIVMEFARLLESQELIGFDIRRKPIFTLIYLNPNVYALIPSKDAPDRYISEWRSLADRGVTPRGDVFSRISDSLYIATERR